MSSLVLLLAAAACSTTPTVDDASAVAERRATEGPVVGRELPYPPQTRGVVRLRLDSFDQLVGNVGPTLTPGGDESQAPDGRAIGALVVRHLLEGRIEEGFEQLVRMQIGKSDGPADSAVTQLEPTRPVIAAVTSRQNETVMRQLRYGVPGAGLGSGPIGLSWRVFFPARDGADALLEEFKELCGSGEGSCRQVARMFTHRDWVVADFYPPDVNQKGRERFEAALSEAGPVEAGDYFERQTPATRSFLTNQAAVSVFGRSSDIAPVGALLGSQEVYRALVHVVPGKAARLLHKGRFLASTVFAFDDPQAREIEDFALFLRAPSQGTTSLESVSTQTKRGRRVGDAMAFRGKLPVIEAPSDGLEFEFGSEMAAGFKSAAIPRLFESTDSSEMFRLLRDSGVWGWYTLVVGSPVGLFKAGDRNWSRTRSGPSPWRQLIAARARIGLQQDAEARLGYAIGGGVALLVDGQSTLPARLEQFGPMARQLFGTPLTVEVRPRQQTNRKLVLLAFGATAETFGEPAALSSGFRARLEGETVADLVEALGRRMPADRRMIGAIQRFLRSAERLRATSLRQAGAVGMRIRAGGSEPDRFAIPSVESQPKKPELLPDCLQGVADESRRRLKQMAAVDGSRRQLVDRLLETLERRQEQCAGEASAARDIEWMRARWLQQRALLEARSGYFDEAVRSLGRACKLGAEHACDQKSSVEAVAAQYRAPRATAHRQVDLDRPHRWFVGRRAILEPEVVNLGNDTAFTRPWTTEEMKAELEQSDSKAASELIEELELLSLEAPNSGRISGVFLPVDQTVGSGLLGRLVATAGAKTVGRQRQQRRRLLGKSEAPKEVTGVALHVRRPDSQEAGMPTVVLRTDNTNVFAESRRYTLEVGASGIGIERAGEGGIDPADGCGGGSPTLCTADPDETGRLLDRLLAGEASAEAEQKLVDRLLGQYELERLSDVLPDAEPRDRSPVFVLSFQREVPVALVADIAGELGRYTRSIYGEDGLPHIRLTKPDQINKSIQNGLEDGADTKSIDEASAD